MPLWRIPKFKTSNYHLFYPKFTRFFRGVMGSLKLEFSRMGLQQRPKIPTYPHTFRIVCGGLRNGPRKPMWRTRVLSYEAIHAVQSLKLAQNSPSRLEQVFNTKLSRLLKADLEDTLAELQRQNELDLAFKVCLFLLQFFGFSLDIESELKLLFFLPVLGLIVDNCCFA